MDRRQGFWIALAAAVVMTGALSAAVLGAGSTPPVITLRLGTAEHAGGPNDSPVLHQFAKRVEELSGGGLRVELRWALADDTNDYEQKIIGMVQRGDLELGWSGARAFDVLGVTSFQALQAPFLITSNDLLRQVMASTMPEQMLAGLAPLGLIGLGAYPDHLRHPISYHKPFVSLADFEGTTFRVPRSNASDAIYTALGSTPVHLNGVPFDTALSQDTLDGIDYALIAAPNLVPAWITSNLVLYPRVSVIFLSADVVNTLASGQLDVLRLAAAEAFESSLAALPEVDSAERFCQGGGRVAVATQEDLAAMARATAWVTAEMEKDPQTKAFIDQMEALKASVAAPAAPHVPAGCVQEVAQSTPELAGDRAGIPAGTYTTTATAEDAQRTGVPDVCATQHGGAALTLLVGNGLYSLFESCDTVAQQKVDRGTYSSTADTVDMGPDCCPGQSTVYSWTLVDHVLTLAVIDETNSPPGDVPFNHFLFEHRWAAVSD